MKNSIKFAGFLTACICASSASALTLQQVLPSITVNPDMPDNLAEQYEFTDSGSGTSGAVLFQELASYAPNNKMGLYDLSDPNTRLEVFGGSAVPGSNTWVTFDETAGTVEANGVTESFGPGFGVYIDSSYYAGGGLFFSEQARNEGALETNHVMSYDTLDVDGVFPFSQVFAFEDLTCGINNITCDADFTDMVIGMTDVRAVPIPAAAWLFGSGLIGLAGIARRKKTA